MRSAPPAPRQEMHMRTDLRLKALSVFKKLTRQEASKVLRTKWTKIPKKAFKENDQGQGASAGASGGGPHSGHGRHSSHAAAHGLREEPSALRSGRQRRSRERPGPAARPPQDRLQGCSLRSSAGRIKGKQR